MREILFRAWLIKEKKMVEVKSIHLGTKKIMYGYSEDRFCYGNRTCSFDDCELMEFTGLTDKNGKNIFEGDIVKTDSIDACLSRGEPHIVEFDDKYNCGFILKWKSVTQSFGNVWRKSEVFEVIGNIHDNPELLERNK